MLFAKFGEDGRLTEAHNDDTATEIPADAVALSAEQWSSRFDLRLVNGALVVDPADPVQPTSTQTILAKIVELESTVTNRRIRESVLGVDNGWMKLVDDQIADLRKGLT
jgi:hypothetical protein